MGEEPTISNDDLIRLVHELGPSYGLMVWLGVYFGMRYQEAAGLTVGSVENLLQGEIKINQVLTRQRTLKDKTKTKAGERNIVDRELATEIAAHLARRGVTASDTNALLFVNKRGKPLSYSSWRTNVWVPALQRSGLAQKRRTVSTWVCTTCAR